MQSRDIIKGLSNFCHVNDFSILTFLDPLHTSLTKIFRVLWKNQKVNIDLPRI